MDGRDHMTKKLWCQNGVTDQMLGTTVVDEGTYCISIYLSIFETLLILQSYFIHKKQMKLDKVWGRGPLGAQSEYFLCFPEGVQSRSVLQYNWIYLIQTSQFYLFCKNEKSIIKTTNQKHHFSHRSWNSSIIFPRPSDNDRPWLTSCFGLCHLGSDTRSLYFPSCSCACPLGLPACRLSLSLSLSSVSRLSTSGARCLRSVTLCPNRSKRLLVRVQWCNTLPQPIGMSLFTHWHLELRAISRKVFWRPRLRNTPSRSDVLRCCYAAR